MTKVRISIPCHRCFSAGSCDCDPNELRIEELEKQVEAIKAEAAEWQRQAIYHNKKHGKMISINRHVYDGLLRVSSSLAAAISLLERTPKAKKAAPSDTMFEQMIKDYNRSLDTGRELLRRNKDSLGGDHV